jgi:hypothetical protein
MSEFAGQPHTIDRTGWPRGPWDSEPDRVDWKTKAGLHAIALRQPSSGGWCGYVGVEPGHPYYPGGSHASGEGCTFEGLHSECTYAGHCAGHVCHVPEPGEPDVLFWYGFDYLHYMDAAPGHDDAKSWPDASGVCLWEPDAVYVKPGEVKGVYRTLDYVRADMEEAARALQALSVGDAP